MNTDAPLVPAPLPENLTAPARAGRALVMGVVNVTPDSFSDGGRWITTDLAVAHGRQLIAQGADLLDVGGESTRPGARRVDPAEEQNRVLPVIRELAAAGVDLADVTSRLEYDGVAKFEIAWADLIRAVTEQLHDH